MARAWRAHSGWMTIGFFGPLLGMVAGLVLFGALGRFQDSVAQQEGWLAVILMVFGFPAGIFVPALAGAMTGASDEISDDETSRARAALRGSGLFVMLCVLAVAVGLFFAVT